MGIYSTHEGLTKAEAIKIIRDRISRIEQMPDPRIVEILEACVQGRYYGDYDKDGKYLGNPEIDGGWSDEFAYNNFWPNFEK